MVRHPENRTDEEKMSKLERRRHAFTKKLFLEPRQRVLSKKKEATYEEGLEEKKTEHLRRGEPKNRDAFAPTA